MEINVNNVSIHSHENVWQRIGRRYNEIMAQADPRIQNWWLMSSPWPSLAVCVAYVMIIQLGKRYMQNRSPYNVRKLLIAYNLSLVVFSGWLVYEFLMAGWLTGYSLGCQPVDYSHSTNALRMASAVWWYYFSKFVELLDTVFFIARKKFNLITFLHVFHHAVMPASWWFGVKFIPGGFGTFGALLNSIIHFFMYTYYGLAALGPQYQRFIWWKKYMTKAQLIQFALVALHCSQLFFIECDYPIIFVWWMLSYMLIFMALFANFYVRTYTVKSTSSRSHASHKSQTCDSTLTSEKDD